MYSKLFSDAGPLLVLPVVSLFFFLAIFFGIVIKAMRTKPSEMAVLASMPLDKEDQS